MNNYTTNIIFVLVYGWNVDLLSNTNINVVRPNRMRLAKPSQNLFICTQILTHDLTCSLTEMRISHAKCQMPYGKCLWISVQWLTHAQLSLSTSGMYSCTPTLELNSKCQQTQRSIFARIFFLFAFSTSRGELECGKKGWTFSYSLDDNAAAAYIYIFFFLFNTYS